jgi:hypothetical protein
MPVLSIIACRILEDELAHVLCQDRHLQHIILIDGQECMGLSQKLRSCHRPHLILSEEALEERLSEMGKEERSHPLIKALKRFCPPPGFWRPLQPRTDSTDHLVVVVSVLKMALHADSRLLRETVCRNINSMSSFSDGILLFYGLCGNSLAEIEEDLIDLPCPLYFLEDGSCQRVDDCIAAALGGNKQYKETLESYPGVGVYFTPMWACNWRDMDVEAKRSSKSEGLGKVLKELGYRKVALLDTGLHFTSAYEVKERIGEVARMNKLEIVSLEGGTEVADNCYAQAKQRLLEAERDSVSRSAKACDGR